MQPTVPKAVVDLTEMVRVAMQRLDQSPLIRQWELRAFDWVVSAELLAQFERTVSEPRLARRIRLLSSRALVAKLVADAVMVKSATVFPHCRDANDDVVIAAAVAARADYIVTSDGDLREDAGLVERLCKEYHIRVVWPVEFLAALSPGK
jgi:putative PIN family toxin of toxin-antitoxin system